MDLKIMPLSYISNALSRDTPLGHVYRTQPNIIWIFGYLARYAEHPMAIVDIGQTRKIISGKKFKIENEDRDMVCNFTHNMYLYTELQNVISLFRAI